MLSFHFLKLPINVARHRPPAVGREQIIECAGSNTIQRQEIPSYSSRSTWYEMLIVSL